MNIRTWRICLVSLDKNKRALICFKIFCISIVELLIYRVFHQCLPSFQFWYRIWIFLTGASFIGWPLSWVLYCCLDVLSGTRMNLSISLSLALSCFQITILTLLMMETLGCDCEHSFRALSKDSFWLQAQQNQTVYIIYFGMYVFSDA